MKYEFLRQNERAHRRTINDAIAVFEAELDLKLGHGFAPDITAKIQVDGLRLPSRDVVGLVRCAFTSTTRDHSFVVPLATSSTFLAKREHGAKRESFDIFQLNDAEIYSSGDLRLKNGAKLRAVEVVPARLPYELTDLERRIIKFAVDKTGEFDRCYRNPFASLPVHLSVGLPEVRVLDYSSFAKNDDRPRLKVAGLKEIQADFLEANDDIKSISRQKISDALAKAGLLVPIRRPKVG